MELATIQKVVLKAYTNQKKTINLSVYNGEEEVGQCDSHSGELVTKTLYCEAVPADRVHLKVTDDGMMKLSVYDIKVYGTEVLTGKSLILFNLSNFDKNNVAYFEGLM